MEIVYSFLLKYLGWDLFLLENKSCDLIKSNQLTTFREDYANNTYLMARFNSTDINNKSIHFHLHRFN